ncbi:malonyl-ACP O-methyltransferase BioC [Fictibacillus sp. Mic-4]|uniref:malonyl-ACP O-methyltransferase BioC n=1 Tax=Fictibacillus sp. Mic-4 TaxID=3132826 RepID=UPI003CF6F634
MINKQLLQKRFSKQAETYDQFAVVQKKMAEEVLAIVKRQKLKNETVAVLEIGCGTGYLTERLCALFPNALIHAVDLAPGMISVAQKRVMHRNVSFLCGDIEEMMLQHKYDLIISNATFQWLNQLEHTLQYLFSHLQQNGVLCFSTFGHLTFQELHASFRQAKRSFQLEDANPPGQPFYSLKGLQKVIAHSLEPSSFSFKGKERLEVQTFPGVRDFLTSIKKIGANNSNEGDYCQRPAVFKKMMKIYESHYRLDDLIKATYHCLYVTIEKNRKDNCK